ncbi:putative reverse transcriptase domain-containing protein, partial [Tanacetum coccineum]
YEIGESSAAATTRPIGGRRADYGFEQDTQDIYAVIADTQDRQIQIYQSVETLFDDSQYHYETARLLDQEALVSQEAWGRSIEAADRRSQVVTSEMLQADHQRQVQLTKALKLLKGLQTQMVEFQRQHGPAKGGDSQRMAPKKVERASTKRHTVRKTLSRQHVRRPHAMINEGVTAALAARDATRNGDDSHTSGTGARRPVQVARECTYPDFLKCQPLNFKGTEGVVGLTQWFEKMESFTCKSTVQYMPCGGTTTPEAAHAMPWRTLKKMMTDKYCPRGEIKKLEFEMWNLKVKGNDVVTYSQRFQELALMCDRMFPEEIDQVEKYVGGLPDTIHGSVMATKPKTMQDAIEFATELMDKKINTWAERQADNKRKSDDTARNNQNQQPNKRQNTRRAYAAGNGDRRPYGGPKPLCSKCNYHHEGPCAPKCHKCNRFGHLGRDCKNPLNVNTGANQRACFECGAQGHFKKDCPKLKNNNRGNQAGNAKAQAKVYAVGNAGANPDNNVVTGTFLLNNRYASILFDTGADRSFVSTAFSSRIVITPTALDHDYNVELALGELLG